MGMPSPGWDWVVREHNAAVRRRRIRRRRRVQRLMLWLLTVVTALVLVVIGMYVRDIGLTPTVTALSSSTRTHSTPSAAGSTGHHVTAKHKGSSSATPIVPVSGPRLADTSSGLSYQLLSSPWTSGCPSILNSSLFVWTAGEHAVAGLVTINGGSFDWHGNACSGQLQPHFAYAGPQDLQPTAMSLVGALDPAYYTGLTHERTTQASSTLQVSGHPAWMVRFLETYPDAISEQLAWTSELAAVVVVDRGTGLVPAVFYVSVPANLGTQNVATLVGSLRLSAP
jgi:hypothetical protein